MLKEKETKPGWHLNVFLLRMEQWLFGRLVAVDRVQPKMLRVDSTRGIISFAQEQLEVWMWSPSHINTAAKAVALSKQLCKTHQCWQPSKVTHQVISLWPVVSLERSKTLRSPLELGTAEYPSALPSIKVQVSLTCCKNGSDLELNSIWILSPSFTTWGAAMPHWQHVWCKVTPITTVRSGTSTLFSEQRKDKPEAFLRLGEGPEQRKILQRGFHLLQWPQIGLSAPCSKKATLSTQKLMFILPCLQVVTTWTGMDSLCAQAQNRAGEQIHKLERKHKMESRSHLPASCHAGEAIRNKGQLSCLPQIICCRIYLFFFLRKSFLASNL